jgi:hypothetical protein
MIGDNFVAHGDDPGTFINISTGRSQFIIGLAMKTISVLSTTKSNKTQHALIISGIILFYFIFLCDCNTVPIVWAISSIIIQSIP